MGNRAALTAGIASRPVARPGDQSCVAAEAEQSSALAAVQASANMAWPLSSIAEVPSTFPIGMASEEDDKIHTDGCFYRPGSDDPIQHAGGSVFLAVVWCESYSGDDDRV